MIQRGKDRRQFTYTAFFPERRKKIRRKNDRLIKKVKHAKI